MPVSCPDGKYYEEHIFNGASHENAMKPGFNPSELMCYLQRGEPRALYVEVKGGEARCVWAPQRTPTAPSEDLKELGKSLNAKAKAKAKAAPKKKAAKKKKK